MKWLRKPTSPGFVGLVLGILGVLLFFFYCAWGNIAGYW